MRQEYKQFKAATQQVAMVDAHIHKHKEAYLFGAGVAVGVVGMRLFGRPAPIVITNVIQQGG